MALLFGGNDNNTTYSNATQTASGLMSNTDKAKLDGIANGANNYTLPSAGSSIGGVKSGGDVTISSGVITVNDDSHNHVISNVDGLQSALDGKAASSHSHDGTYYTETEVDTLLSGKANASHTHTIANITNLQSTLDGKASTSHGAHVNYSATAPVMDGVASAGAASTVARSDHKHPVDTSRASQTDLDALETVVSGKANSSHTHTIANVTNLQNSLDAKQATITGGASTITSSNLTANRALVSNSSGKVAVSAVTSIELGYLDGVTSNVQTQLDGKSPTSHTHSYAGSSSVGGAATSANKLNINAGDANTPVYFSNGVPVACTSLDLNTSGSSTSCTGNSATATKLATARTITLSNDLQGSASFDGSGNINIVASNYQAGITSSNTNTYPYHRIAYVNNITSQWSDKDAVFEIRHTYNGGGYGRFKVSYRTNGTGTATQASVTWLYRYNIASDDITIGTYGVTGNSCYADIFYKTSSTYARAEVIQVLGDRAWTLVTSTETASAASHTECWASISDAATALHSQAYTNTYTSSDGGVVNNANVATKLGSATIGGTAKPIYLNGGAATACSSTVGGTTKPVYMNAGTITACSSTVGSATQPVYMNGGTITACTYTLGKSVPSNAVFTDTNTKVTNTLATTTKAYVTGTTSATTNTGTQVFDTGVYLDTTAGKLTATTFNGTNYSGSGVATVSEVETYLGI